MRLEFGILMVLVLSSSMAFAKITVITKDSALSTTAVKSFPFYVYRDGKPENFYPSGSMGDIGDMEYDFEAAGSSGKTGKYCLKVSYSAKNSGQQGWAGIYWQFPEGNWGNTPGGFDLTGAKHFLFYVRGEKGGENVSFKLGGISGTESYDSFAASTGILKLTKEWKKISIDLTDKDLSSVIGGFCILFSTGWNPNAETIYLDDVHYSDK